MLTFLKCASAFSLLAVTTASAMAQDSFPSRPITVINPWAAGGINDIAARIITDHMARTLGQPLVIENRGGGGSKIGTEMVVKAHKDGYTLLFQNMVHAILPTVAAPLNYDPVRDFTPISHATSHATLLVAHPSVPVNTLPELIDYAKKNPGKINYASSGVGSVGQLLTERFRLATGLSLVHVPYPGGNATIAAALMAGDVHISVSDIGSMRQLANDGRIKYLATLADERSHMFPQAPAITEVGMPELRKIFSPFFFGFFLARGTDPARVEKLATDINATLEDPAVREKLVGLGYNAAALGGTRPDDFRKIILEELNRVETVVRDAKITLD